MKVKLNFASDNIFNGNLKNFFKLVLDVSEDRKKISSNDKPVFLIPVIDRSGSMSSPASKDFNYSNDYSLNSCTYSNSLRGGLPVSNFLSAQRSYERPYFSKLDCAKSATVELLDLLHDGDKFALVTFDDSISVAQNPIDITEKSKKEIKNNISQIVSGGCTNISDALLKAADLITHNDTAKYNCKIVLLSDGCANIGLDKEEQFISLMPKILDRNISTSSVGLGDDYDLGIMEAISGNCAGTFNHISDALAIKDIFASELKTAQNIVCKNTVVKISLPDMVAFKPNYNNYTEEIQKDNIYIKLGNLYNNKTLYYEFSVLDETLKDITISVEVSYETPDGGENTATMSRKIPIISKKEDLIENKEIIDEIVNTVKDRYIYNASKAVSTNDFETASVSFAESSATMQSIVTAYNCCSTTAMEDMNSIQSSLTSTTSQDAIRKTFDNSSKKLRNS